MKIKVDQLVVGKLVPVPVDLSKLNDVVENDFVKKIECNELVKKKVNELENKINDHIMLNVLLLRNLIS